MSSQRFFYLFQWISYSKHVIFVFPWLTVLLARVTASVTVSGRLLIVTRVEPLISASLLPLSLLTASVALESTALSLPLLVAAGAAVAPLLWTVLVRLVRLSWRRGRLVGLSLVLPSSRLVAVVVRWSGVVVALLVVWEPRLAPLLLLTEPLSVLVVAAVSLSVVAICEMEKNKLARLDGIICKLRLCRGWGRN